MLPSRSGIYGGNIRYSGGYYYGYIYFATNIDAGAKYVIEIDYYNAVINVWTFNSSGEAILKFSK